jgi:hypothetical protein
MADVPEQVTASVDINDWYTAAQAAKKLNTSVKYIRTLAVQYGLIAYMEVSPRLFLYSKADVDARTVNRGHPGRPKKVKEEDSQA